MGRKKVDEHAELRALVAAYSALADTMVTLHPSVLAAVNAASRPGGQEPPDGPHTFSWPEGNRSVRGAAWKAVGGLENAFEELQSVADGMALLKRRLDEVGR